MLLSYLWTSFLLVSFLCSWHFGRGQFLSASIQEGASAGIQLALSIGGSLCLWSGVGKLMEAAGLTSLLSKWLRPLLTRVFPTAKQDRELAGFLSGNICANLLGLGNAATPMGIQAARRMKQRNIASDELCRLIVLNTASIQLIPTNVAAIRASLGCCSPFDILPSVWLSSFASAGLGLAMAWLLGKLWADD